MRCVFLCAGGDLLATRISDGACRHDLLCRVHVLTSVGVWLIVFCKHARHTAHTAALTLTLCNRAERK